MAQKRRYLFCIVAGIALLTFGFGCEEGDDVGSASDALNSGDDDDDAEGNGAPCGPHYTLNIIGSEIDKQPALNNPGRRIFPPISGSAVIMLSEGDFRVLDGNGTDGPAEFRLPNPDPENDGAPTYTVYARTMARPGGTSTTTACAADAVTGEEYCSAESLELARESGKPVFSEVSDQLLYLYADVNKDGDVERYPLFDDAFVDYYWLYENEDLKHAQLRFYGDGTGGDDDDDTDTDIDTDTDTDTGDDDDDTDSDTGPVV